MTPEIEATRKAVLDGIDNVRVMTADGYHRHVREVVMPLMNEALDALIVASQQSVIDRLKANGHWEPEWMIDEAKVEAG